MKRFIISALAMALGAVSAHAADVTVGVDNSSNCVPFGCAQSNGLAVFQQIYTGSAFGAGATIGSVSFFKDSTAVAGATLETMSFNLSFYVATTSVAGLTTNPATNRGALLADFGIFSISGAQPDVLTFASPTAFAYDPSAGNLLLQLTVLSDTAPGAGAVFQSDIRTPAQGAVSRRLIVTDFDFNFTATNGLVTGFSSATRAVAPVPEPASWTLMIIGFGAVGAAQRRRSLGVRFA